jgi:hypothetical protein
MSSTIKDAAGGGNGMKVDKNNRAHTQSVTATEAISETIKGNAYNINSGLISFSTDGTLMYIKNNEDEALMIEAIALGSFNGVTHSDDPYITLISNPTGGDLLSDLTAVPMNQNRNTGSSNTLAATVYIGKSSGTVSGGDDMAILQVNAGSRNFYPINFLLQKGSSMAIKLTLNESSGSANYYAALICYLTDSEFL